MGDLLPADIEAAASAPVPPEAFMPDLPQPKGLHWSLKYGPVAANLLDAYTTERLLHSGGREGNPMMRPFVDNEPLFYLGKAGVGLLTGLLADKVARDGHPGWAKAISGIGIGVPLGAAVSNGFQLQKQRGR